VATKLISEVRDGLVRLKWFLWHGNVFRALQTVDDLIIDLETLHPGDEPGKLLMAAHEFDIYLRAMPNDPELRGTPQCGRGDLGRVHRVCCQTK
jgi:hypothetical protein